MANHRGTSVFVFLDTLTANLPLRLDVGLMPLPAVWRHYIAWSRAASLFRGRLSFTDCKLLLTKLKLKNNSSSSLETFIFVFFALIIIV